jgi:hypothetical protein
MLKINGIDCILGRTSQKQSEKPENQVFWNLEFFLRRMSSNKQLKE